MTDIDGRQKGSLDPAYARHLQARSDVWWKRLLNVQAPYRWNLRRLKPGFVLDVGCGTGRNLQHLDGHGVGIDPNPACLAVARSFGLKVVEPERLEAEFPRAQRMFDTLLVSHVLEHMSPLEAEALVRTYAQYVRPGGRVILMTPQEAGYAKDTTHVNFCDFDTLNSILRRCDIEVERTYSFPFLRLAGHVFPYNEFIVIGRVSAG